MTNETIMIVDDTPENLMVLSALLQRTGYKVSAFPRGRMALSAAKRQPPDLVLLDINMPEMDGFAVCEAFQQDKGLIDIPIIFISAMDSTEDKVHALRCGGVDYITKPFQAEEVYARVKTHLQLSSAREVLRDFNKELKEKVAQQVDEINQSQIATIFALAKLSHTRDDDTGYHLERVQHFCKLLSTELAGLPQYIDIIDKDFIEIIFHASPLHDLGKVGIKDAILLKPGALTPDEFKIMQTHTTLGAATLEAVHSQYPSSAFIKTGIEIAKHHHEKWNGAGYPDGLSGTAIPLSARIMSLVDVYDALRARRPYKEPFSHEKSRSIIMEGSGTGFDPQLVEIFAQIHQKFDAKYNALADK